MVWEENLKLFPQTKLQYPDENLIRLFSGKYIPIPKPPAKVMDHGFGHGNNLLFFSDKGYDCFGCEISDYLIKETGVLFRLAKRNVDLRPIKNLRMPFENNFFDIVISWNVIHYNGTKRAVSQVIHELYRILKPGGVLILSTVHPKSSFLDRMKCIRDGSYLIEKGSIFDNRKGLIFYIASSVSELKTLFKRFQKVMVGNASFNLFNHAERNAWFLVYAVK